MGFNISSDAAVTVNRDGYRSPAALAKSSVPSGVLVQLYNRANPGKPIKKFESRDVAAKRVFPLLGDLAMPGSFADAVPAAATSAAPVTPASGSAKAKGKRLGIGRRMAELLRSGSGTKDVLSTIKQEFPTSTAGPGDVSIIRRRIARGDL